MEPTQQDCITQEVRALDGVQRRRTLQDTRLAEVQAFSLEEWQELRLRMSRAGWLPKLAEHMRKHGADFAELGVTNAEQMEALFLQHIRRTDLAHFTYVSTQPATQYRQWVLIGMDNGVVALYNESKQQHWSFMRPENLRDYMDGNRGLWVQVEVLAGRVKVRKWQRR